VIDDNHVYRPAFGFELQPELFLERREDRRPVGRRRRFVGRA